MAQKLALEITGLHLHNNTFSEVPAGALAVAENIVIDKLSVAESRRGQQTYGSKLALEPGESVDRIFVYRNTTFAHYGENITADSNYNGDWVAISGGFASPDPDLRVRNLESNGNLYLTTESGIRKLDAISGTWRDAGANRALDVTVSGWDATGFQSDDTAVAYRVVWGYTDDSSNEIISAPSQRAVMENNTGNSQNVGLVAYIPDGVDESWFFQFYRSGESATADDTPSDNLQLVKAGNPTTAELALGFIEAVDETPNSLRGSDLYTNPDQEGILNANFQPPIAKDMVVFNDVVFYANTETKYSITSSMLGAGNDSSINFYVDEGTDVTSGNPVVVVTSGSHLNVGMSASGTGIVAGSKILAVTSSNSITLDTNPDASSTTSIMFRDVVTVAGVDYHADYEEDTDTQKFLVVRDGLDAQNLSAASLSLVANVNRNVNSGGVYAFNLSGPEDIPGKLQYEERALGGGVFSIATSNGNAFNPTLSLEGTDATNEQKQSRVMYSKLQQPESVPSLNFLQIGSENFPIRRIIALRDSVFVFKKDGVYKITGTTGDFRVALTDGSVIIKAPETAQVLNNQIYTFSDQGVVVLSETGADLKSFPIESELLETSSSLFENFEKIAFATAVESDRKYLLFLPQTIADETATQVVVFNYITEAWTKWTTERTAATVHPEEDLLYLAGTDVLAGHDHIYRERKNFSRTDYADEQYPVTITGVTDSDPVTVLGIEPNVHVVVGQTLKQSGTESVITATGIHNVTLFNATAWDDGDADVYNPIQVALQFVPESIGNVGLVKQIREVDFLFTSADYDDVTVGFSSNFSINEETVDMTAVDLGCAWGSFPWGTVPWGIAVRGAQMLRTYVPLEKQRCSWLNISVRNAQAFTSFSLAGISIQLESMSEKFGGPF